MAAVRVYGDELIEAKTMNTAGALILGLFVAVVTTSAYGQTQHVADAGTHHRFVASAAAPEPGDGQSRPLFTIGRLAVGVDAPVEPSYNAAANRNLAADPLWGPAL